MSLIERLREAETFCGPLSDVNHLFGEAASTLEAQQAQIDALREALTPSGDTKAAYHGEFKIPLVRRDECGEEYTERVYVPWDTVKEIMAAILERAHIQGEGHE